MLSLRFVIFAAIAGIALWALFSLLDTLREPELLRSTKAVVVKGCDPMESEQAIQACPSLFCEKALLDARVVPLRSTFTVATDKTSNQRRLIAGSATTGASHGETLYACVLEGNKVVMAKQIDAARMSALANENADWTLEP